MSEIKYLDLAGLTEFKEELDRVRLSDNLNITEALNDISGSIGNGTLTIKKNNVSQGTFTANLKTNSEINITVPTNITDLGQTAIAEIQNLIRYGQLDVSDLTDELKLALHESIASTYDYLSEADVEDKLEAYGKIIHYDSSTQKIQLKNGDTVLSEFSAADFISDGMVEDVRIASGTGDNVGKTVLLFDFNTASGITDIEIPLEDIFNASNYYTKTEVDNLLPDTLTQSEVNTGTNTTGKLVSAKIIKDSIDNAIYGGGGSSGTVITTTNLSSEGISAGFAKTVQIGTSTPIGIDSNGNISIPDYGNSTGVIIVTLNSAPVSGANGTHLYTIDGTTYEFKAGDEVRVQDGDDLDTNDYLIYKLYDRIDSENTVTVYWGISGSSGEIDDIVETCIINLSTTNHTYDSELIGATITFTIGGQDTTKTWNGNPISMKILTGTTYSVTIGNVTGFTTPSSGISERVAVSGNTLEVNAIYTYRPISLTVGTNLNSLADLISANAYVTINGVLFDINNNQSSTQTFITHVTTDNLSVPFVFSSVTGYTSPSIVDDGSLNSFNVTYNTTIVTCTAMVDPAAGKSSNDVIFIVSSDSISSTNVSSGGTIKIPTGEVITITSTDLSSFGYSHNISPVSGTTASGNSMSFTATYLTETLTILTINVDEGSVLGATFTVNGISKVYGTDTLVWHLPYGVSDVITHDISGYSVTITKNPNTDVADSASKIVTIDCTIQVVEIKAIDSSGNEVSYDNATSSCVGVVVRDMDKGVEFFIDKRWSNGSAAGASYNNYKSFSPALYNNDPSIATDGRQLIYHGADYGTGSGATADNYRELGAPVNLRTWAFLNHSNGHTGAHNTNIFVNSSLVYSETATNNASKFCRSLANPITGLYDGFLGNDAEWIVVHDNLEDVNNMLTKIGSTPFSYGKSGSSSYTLLWSSNEYSSNTAWLWYWNSSYSYPYMLNNYKSYAYQNSCAVPFFPVISEATQIKVLCLDGTEISPSEVNTSTPSNYVGVIVRNISNNINFIIGKTFTKGTSASSSANNYKSWYSSNVSGGTTTVNNTGYQDPTGIDASNYKTKGASSTLRAWSLKAHNMGESGIQNTRKIISTLSSGTATNCAAKFCNSQTLTVNGVTKNGYLGSLAEWIYIHDNFEVINSALNSIGGTPLNIDTSGYNSSGIKYSLFWTSTEYSSGNAWGWNWLSSRSYPYMYYNSKSDANQYDCAVPFFPVDSNN